MANVKSIFGISSLPVANPFPLFEKSALEIGQTAKTIRGTEGDKFINKSVPVRRKSLKEVFKIGKR